MRTFTCERCNLVIDQDIDDADGTGDVFEFRPDDRICCHCFWTLETEEEENPQPSDTGTASPKYPNQQQPRGEQNQ